MTGREAITEKLSEIKFLCYLWDKINVLYRQAIKDQV